MKNQENIGYASVNSSYALPPPHPPLPPGANSWEFFFLWMANLWEQGHLSCQMAGGEDKSKGCYVSPIMQMNQVRPVVKHNNLYTLPLFALKLWLF